ncbi:hypothetical protein KQI67_28275 [Bacillus albus]|uniref:hypothetical protein n=1 Tax=Bacillus albus TaxID=2026189 RepID=UPI001C107B5B|nr:hypothetical protein [Bacillus albus]MBU5220472.1 hypothetical protein [Bacillus albus]
MFKRIKSIKEKFFFTFFKEEVSRIERTNNELLKSKIESLEEKQAKKLKDIGMKGRRVEWIFTNSKDAEIIGIAKNKEKKEMIVYKECTECSVYIKLLGESSRGFERVSQINARIYKNSDYRYMKIEDIQMIDNYMGNGSIAMEYLIKTSKKMGISYIEGVLAISSVNGEVIKEHFDRLIHYYEKFGFEVNIESGSTLGNIKKVL